MGRAPAFMSATSFCLALIIASTACSERTPLQPAYEPILQQGAVPGKGERILVCPTREILQKSAVVGPEGGTVAAGDHRIEIVPGALSERTMITVSAPAGRLVLLDITAGDADHFRFERPVMITISYARCKRALHTLESPMAWHVDGAGRLLERMGGFSDNGGRSVTFEANHLSTYAVAY